jgi:hypothetical protein
MFIKDTVMYLRSYATNAWTTWKKVNIYQENITTGNITLNDKLSTGVYYLSNTLSSSQAPTGINGLNHVLQVFANGTFVSQKLITMRNATDKFPTEYGRFSKDNGATWTPWKSPLEGDFTICYQKSVDFNTVVDKGYYRVNTSGFTATNAPTDFTNFGILEVIGADSYVIQRLTQSDGTKFTRFSTNYGSSWTTWKCPFDSDATKYYQTNVNFNTILEKGTFRINTTGFTATNAPSTGYTNISILIVDGSSNYVSQELRMSDGTSKRRITVDNGTTWTAWA